MLLEIDETHSSFGLSQILHGVSFGAGEGEVAAVIGRNGIGTSTTMKSAIGLAPPRQGHVRVGGEDVTGKPVRKIARLRVAYRPEERRIFADLTVRQNLDMGMAAVKAVDDNLSWDLDRVIDLFLNPGNRRSALGRPEPGGGHQVLAIGRKLMSNLQILVLDEPSEGLAPDIVDAMRDALTALKGEEFTVQLAEQSLEFVKGLVDRGIIRDKGTVVHESAMADLPADQEVTNRYLAA